MEILNVLGLLLGISVLIFLSFKGIHTVLAAILASVVIIIFNSMNFWVSINKNFMTPAGGFVSTYFLLFVLEIGRAHV